MTFPTEYEVTIRVSLEDGKAILSTFYCEHDDIRENILQVLGSCIANGDCKSTDIYVAHWRERKEITGEVGSVFDGYTALWPGAPEPSAGGTQP